MDTNAFLTQTAEKNAFLVKVNNKNSTQCMFCPQDFKNEQALEYHLK